MAHRRVEHAPLAMVDDDQHRFVAIGDIGAGSGEDLHVPGRATELVVEFVLHVQPDRRHPRRNRMPGVTHDHREGPLSAMVSTGAGGIVAHRSALVVEVDVGAAAFVATPPAAEADHLVVGRPRGERVVGGVNRHEAPTASDVRLEGLPGLLWPIGGAVPEVAHDHGVSGEVRAKGGIWPLRCMGDDVDGEQARLFKGRLHHLRRRRPVAVVVLTIDDQGPHRLGCRRPRRSKQPHHGPRNHPRTKHHRIPPVSTPLHPPRSTGT